MRVLIRGAHFVNKGAEAMLRTVQVELGKRFEHATFFVDRTSVLAGTETMAANAGLRILKRPTDSFSLGWSFARNFLISPQHSKAWLLDSRYVTGWKKCLENVDAVIDVSGYAYAEPFGLQNVLRTATIVDQAWRSKIPYIFLPQAWGPFSANAEFRTLLHRIYKRSKFLFARDKQSQGFLADLLQLPASDIPLAPDIAFLFGSSGVSVGRELIGGLGLPDDKPIVCLAPNMRVYERSAGFGASNEYLQVLIAVGRFFLERDVAVMLVPHEINLDSRPQMDDRVLCEFIRLKLGDEKNVAAITSSMPAEDIKAMIACSDLLVGSRFHAIVGALQSRVPVIALGWSHKYGELIDDFGLGQYVFDYTDTSQKLDDMLKSSWENRLQVKQLLEARVPSIEAEVTKMFDLISNSLSHK